MLPNEPTDPWILRNNLKVLIFRAEGTRYRRRLWRWVHECSRNIPSQAIGLITSWRALHIYIVHEGSSYVRHFVLYDERDVSLQDLDQIGSSHRKGSEMQEAEGSLERCEVTRLDG